jgi:hypothetical protein
MKVRQEQRNRSSPIVFTRMIGSPSAATIGVDRHKDKQAMATRRFRTRPMIGTIPSVEPTY